MARTLPPHARRRIRVPVCGIGCGPIGPQAALLLSCFEIARIREALGTTDEVPITITGPSLRQPTPGCTSRFPKGRIFIVGDAAHVSVPTGGMGNNAGFVGIRNLAWKLAFVLRRISALGILETWPGRAQAARARAVDIGVRITQTMIPMMFTCMERTSAPRATTATTMAHGSASS